MYIKMPFVKQMQTAETSGGRDTRRTPSLRASGNSEDSIFASWKRFVLEMYAFIFTHCCRLPPSTSRLDHLAKHFVAVQRDVVGCFNGPLCHLLTVQVELDFVWRDRDVELWGERTRLQLNPTFLTS